MTSSPPPRPTRSPAGSAEGGPPGSWDISATPRTAVAWIPPAELWPPVQDLRRRYDPQIHRWPPHVNVLFGFVPESGFDQAVPLLSEAAAQVPVFTARLEGVRTFRHRARSTVWLDPAAAGEEAWLELHRSLRRRFPRCGGSRAARDFTPHLSLGRTGHPEAVAADCAARLTPTTVTVWELVLLARRGDGPMLPRATLALGSGELRLLPDPGPDAPGPEGPDWLAPVTDR